MRLIDADVLLYNLEGTMAVSPTGYIHGDTIVDMIGDAPIIELDTDTISRQDAINLIERYCDNGCEISEYKWCPDCQQSKFAEMIKALPQSPSRPRVIHCKDCKWRNDVGHWVGCPILNSDDDNYCSYAELP